MHLAEFTDDASLSIINPGLIRENLENPPLFLPGSRTDDLNESSNPVQPNLLR
jgi:hypothetical protein